MSAKIGDNIKRIRMEKGITQDDLAQMTSASRITISKYETGRIEPGAVAIRRIADALEVSADVLLGREEKPESDSDRRELNKLREILRSNPDYRMMFRLSRRASAKELRGVVAMLKSFTADDSHDDEPLDFLYEDPQEDYHEENQHT